MVNVVIATEMNGYDTSGMSVEVLESPLILRR